MGTKTVDETGAETGPEARTDEEKVDVTKSDAVGADEVTEADDAEDTEDREDADELDAATADGPTGVVGRCHLVLRVGLGDVHRLLVALGVDGVGGLGAGLGAGLVNSLGSHTSHRTDAL